MKALIFGFVLFWGTIATIVFTILRMPEALCRTLLPYGFGLLIVLLFTPIYLTIGTIFEEEK